MSESLSTGRQHSKDVNHLISPVLAGALLVGVLIHLVGFFIFRVESVDVPIQSKSEALVSYISKNGFNDDLVLEEQAFLLDSAPLFIPTQWNSAQRLEIHSRDTIYSRFPDYEPAINVVDRLLPAASALVEDFKVSKPSDLVASQFWRFFDGFGQGWQQVVAGKPSKALAEAFVLEDVYGNVGTANTFTVNADLEFDGSSQVLSPVHLLVRVSQANLLSFPIVSATSGSVTFDQAALRWVSKSEVYGQFPNGYLSIRVFPPSH